MRRFRLLIPTVLVLVALLACKRSNKSSTSASAAPAAPPAAPAAAPAATGPAALSLTDASGSSVASVSGATASYHGLACTVAGGGAMTVSCGSSRIKVKARDDGGIKLQPDTGAEIKLKLKEDGWKIEDGGDHELARIKRKEPGYVLEVDARRVATASITGTSAEVRDANGATLFKGAGLAHHAELALALALPDTVLTPAERAAMLAWVAR